MAAGRHSSDGTELHRERLPLLVPATVFMGKVYSRYFRTPTLRSPTALVLAGAVMAVSLSSAARLYEFRARENPETSSEFQLAEQLQRVSDSSDKVISMSPDPTVLYLAHRKGWRSSLTSLQPERLRVMIGEGARYVAGTRSAKGWSDGETRRFGELQREYGVAINTDRYYIIRLVAEK